MNRKLLDLVLLLFGDLLNRQIKKII